MKVFWATAFLWLAALPAMAGETWQPVYVDEFVSVAVDAASFSREKQIVTFRQREVMLKSAIDPASMRTIQEVQYRRQADCAGRKLSVLSRTVFSDQGALMHYEANKPSAANWETPQPGKDFKLLEGVCGSA